MKRLLLLLCLPLMPAPLSAQTLVIYGSSVAHGWNAGRGNIANRSFVDSYAALLTERLEAEGWTVHNASVGGRNTALGIEHFDRDVLPLKPDVVLLGFALGNEGLTSSQEPDRVRDRFVANLRTLSEQCRTRGIQPVIGLVYPHANYSPRTYQTVIDTNILLQRDPVPALNFLGALDDGNGRWQEGLESDPAHPNTAGHLAMFRAIPPGLFAAVLRGQSPPLKTRSPADGFLRVVPGPPVLELTPAAPLFSFSISLRVRNASGTLLEFLCPDGTATLSLSKDTLRFECPAGKVLSLPALPPDQTAVLTLVHAAHRGETRIHVGEASASLAHPPFSPGRIRVGASEGGELADLLLARSAWTPAEAALPGKGEIPHASLDLYAPLHPDPVLNLAPARIGIRNLHVPGP